MYERFGERAEFLFVYILEAHPADGWQVQANVREDIVCKQPKTSEERRKIATRCRDRLKIAMPVLVDDMDNSTDKAYAAWPDRIYVVGKDGRIAYVGGPGPRGFRPDEVGRFLQDYLREDADETEPVPEDRPAIEPVGSVGGPAETVEESVPEPLPRAPEDEADATGSPDISQRTGPGAAPSGPLDVPTFRAATPSAREPASPALSVLKYAVTGLAVLLVAGAVISCYRPRRGKDR